MIGKELKEWRRKYGLTQMELSKHLNVAWATVARWEINVRKTPPLLPLALEAIENRLKKGGGKNRTKTSEKKPTRKEVKKHGKYISKR
jgi:transcriptional regulator with XRE-family HTH domain